MNASNKPKSLRSSRQFRRVYDQGQKYNSPFFSAFILRTDDNEQRFGITVTRKIGCAVVRNRCKRRLREIIRRYYSGCPRRELNNAGFYLVLNARRSMIDADFSEIEKSFERMMEDWVAAK